MWPWRDWVVKAFSENLPFDQFTIWQLPAFVAMTSVSKNTSCGQIFYDFYWGNAIDHEKLTYRFQRRDFRLSDVHGHVVSDIVA